MSGTDVDMGVVIAGIRMRNPVMAASGTFGYGPEYAGYVDLNRLGAIVVKGISMIPWEGNKPPRMVEVPGGLVNAIGLQGPGAAGFVKAYMPFLRQYDLPVIINIWGTTVEAYGDVAAFFDDVEGVDGLELNISCPNIKAGGIAFGTDPVMAAKVIAEARRHTRLPLIPKLSPNVPSVAVFARIAESEGADAVSLINTLPAMVIDTVTRRPVLTNVVGGLSGPGIRAVAVKQVWEAAAAVSIPVIGMGGITCGRDAAEFMLAGAAAVAVGTATFTEPGTCMRVIDELRDYAAGQGLSRIAELTGALKL